MIDLGAEFSVLNAKYFDGFLEAPLLRWNTRLRSSAGRFIPGVRRGLHRREPLIEIAGYLREEARAMELVRDTLAHEMIHYWLWERRRPFGHTEEFWSKLRAIGASRYNPVPRLRPPKYRYRCPHCRTEIAARRKLAPSACLKCCQAHSGGRYDARFRLERVEVESAKLPSA